MDRKPDHTSLDPFDPFQFVLKDRFPQPEDVGELNDDAKQRREAYDEKLRQRFVKFPYLTGLLVARVFNCPVLTVLLELMWRSYSHRNQNPIPLPNIGLDPPGRFVWVC